MNIDDTCKIISKFLFSYLHDKYVFISNVGLVKINPFDLYITSSLHNGEMVEFDLTDKLSYYFCNKDDEIICSFLYPNYNSSELMGKFLGTSLYINSDFLEIFHCDKTGIRGIAINRYVIDNCTEQLQVLNLFRDCNKELFTSEKELYNVTFKSIV